MIQLSGKGRCFFAILAVISTSVSSIAQTSAQTASSPQQATGNTQQQANSAQPQPVQPQPAQPRAAQPRADGEQPTAPVASGPQTGSPNPADIIEKAEGLYKQGDEAFSRGEIDIAGKLFDQAIEVLTKSGVEIRSNSSLDQYYRSLLDRIENRQAQTGELEKTAPAPLDELSKISDADLATVTTGGVKIFGKYDFDFSVADPVNQFLNYFVAGRGRSTMESGLQRAGRYREMAEQIFKEEQVPVDLIWLAQAESVWKPNALSRAAAKGLWQFVPSTGAHYGLAQTAWIDDRSHPEKSTRAAAKYLHWLHDHFAGDWMLAMAAYNAGENRVDEAIAKCGYADFWELHRRGLLPVETRNYVPIILSIIIVSKNQQRYGFNVQADAPVQCETYRVPNQTDLKVVADLCGVPYDTIQDLNPELRRGVSPAGEPYTIRIPKGLKTTFSEAYAKLPEDQRVRKVYVAREEPEGYSSRYRTQVVAYHARSGDTLSAISRRYGVTVDELAHANRMSPRGTLKRGETIKVPMKIQARNRRGYGRYREEPVSSRYSLRRDGRVRESSRESRHHGRR
jgi:membrane-bound lytic murein transglycosylase D